MKKSFSPLYGVKSAVLNANPDRGFRWEIAMDVESISHAGSYEEMKNAAEDRINSAVTDREMVKLAQLYLYLSGFHDREITENGLLAVEACLDALHSRGLKALLRFAYSTGLSVKDQEKDATQDIILRHLQQLKPVLKKKRDFIHVYQAGLIGAWGEWHSEAYPLDKAAVLRDIMEVLVPENMYVQVRLPIYKNLYTNNSDNYKRIGIHNDSVFGKTEFVCSGTGGMDEGTAQWRQLVREAAYAPQDGELFWSHWNRQTGAYCDGFEAILQFSEHRFNSLSVLHGYLDDPDTEITTMGRWKKQILTERWLKENHILYDPAWFQNEDGSAVSRTVFDYVRDYLGYRLQAKEMQINGEIRSGGEIFVRMTVVNYGLSAPFNLKSGFVVLDGNNQIVESVLAGNPAEWHSRCAMNYEDDKLLTHNIDVSLRLPSTSGNYKIGFYVKNELGEGAKLANNLNYTGNIHVLYEFAL